MMEQSHRELMPGVKLTAVQTDKFKTCLLAISFLEPLSKETAAANALIPAVLRRGSKKHPDMTSMAAALDELYGGVIEPMVRKKGETQCIGFVGSFLDDAYIPEKFNVLQSAAQLMAELLFTPAGDEGRFLDEYLESEKENLLNRIRARINDKQQYAIYRLTSHRHRSRSYGRKKQGITKLGVINLHIADERLCPYESLSYQTIKIIINLRFFVNHRLAKMDA
jgi:hypothetical protein